MQLGHTRIEGKLGDHLRIGSGLRAGLGQAGRVAEDASTVEVHGGRFREAGQGRDLLG